MSVVVIVETEHELLDFIGTRHPPCGFAGSLNGREQECDQNTNDRNDNKKFDKGESANFA